MQFTITAATAALLLASTGFAHMEMSNPYPIKSKFDPAQQEADKDYSMTSPLLADGSNFPCKGYQNDPSKHTTATYSAGNTYPMSLAGTAIHNGGSCQLSLSYDNGKTFRVIKSFIGNCPTSMNPSFDFTIPSYAPNGTALLAWDWQNHSGNREFYMNCAQVDIMSSVSAASSSSAARRAAGPARRDTFSSFEDLPYIWKANVPTVNSCTTVEGEDPVYPHPGPDVVYDGGLSASSPPTSGDCDAAEPAGPTYQG